MLISNLKNAATLQHSIEIQEKQLESKILELKEHIKKAQEDYGKSNTIRALKKEYNKDFYATKILLLIDEEFIGTKYFMGMTYFWGQTDYKHALRDLSWNESRKLHDLCIKNNISIAGEKVNKKFDNFIKPYLLKMKRI